MLLTIGMATYDDFDGVYFTLQALKAYQDLTDVELVVVDTKPESCKDTASTCGNVGAKYYHRPDKNGTSASRNHVFEVANGRFVMCIDCHVLLVKDSIKKLKEYLKLNMNSVDIIQGPLLYDDQKNISTHFDQQWRGQMYGTWGTDPKINIVEKIEIPMQGLGLFCMRKDIWPKFNAGFRGFGGEEGYIHEKVRQNGGKAICLSWLKWIHRFGRPKGVPYPLNLKDRVVNYLIGFSELGMNYGEVIEFFKNQLSQQHLGEALKEFSAVAGITLTSSPAAKIVDIPKVAYILDSENSETFTKFNWKHPKQAISNKSFVDAMKDFVNRDEKYCLVLKDGETLEENIIKKLDEWIVIKQDTLKIAALKETETKSLKRKNVVFSYRIAEDVDIDESKSLVISKDFAKAFLREEQQIKLSALAHKNNFAPFVLVKPEFIYRMNPHIVQLDNVQGNLDFCDIREIVWKSKDRWCLDISALARQTTLALCQKGAGIVRVYDYQNEDKDVLKKDLDLFGYVNFIIADMSENIDPPEDGKRALLINYENLPDYMKDFAYDKLSTFIRSGDIVIVTHAEQEINDAYKNTKEYKVEFCSNKCLIATKT